MNRLVGPTDQYRRILLIASLGGAFGAVFGLPWAGLVFGLERHRRKLPGSRRERFSMLGLALVPTAITAFGAGLVVPAVITAFAAQTPNGRPGLHGPAAPRIRATPDGGSSGTGGNNRAR